MIRRDARRLGLVACLGALVLVVGRAAVSGWHTFIRADGISFVMVAHHLTGEGLAAGDNAYRYGRVLYPLLGWLLAGGRSGWLLWSLPVVNCVAFGLSVALAGERAMRCGRPLRHGLVVLAVPALWLCLMVT
ncbi:MAG: hypothetical protein QOG64_647, partial [Acidimicrobiaceae bacterium]|nr:hypothetical protein [Acidimicrobiaceae bacterium]